MVSQELIRVAILWHELWHEGLEEASRLFFNDKNPEGMIATLEPLHELLERVRGNVTFYLGMLLTSHNAGPNNSTRDIVCPGLWQGPSGGT